MELVGKVDHGVIVPQGEIQLPEGAMVRVLYEDGASARSLSAKVPEGAAMYDASVKPIWQQFEEVLAAIPREELRGGLLMARRITTGT